MDYSSREAVLKIFQTLEPIKCDPSSLVGNNNIFLNMATMMKAVEWWLNSEVLQGDVTVGSIEYCDYIFRVTITPKDSEESNATHS